MEIDLLAQNPKFETLNYEESFFENGDIDFMTFQENAAMMLHFEEMCNVEVEETLMESKMLDVDERSVKEISSGEENDCVFKIVDEKEFTILAPKKKRNELKKKKQKLKKSKKNTRLKVKKWKKVDNAFVGLNLTLFPRPIKSTEFEGDIDNLLLDIENELDIFEYRTSDFQNIVELESDIRKLKHLRKDKHLKVQKAHKQVKTKYCRSVRNNNGKKLFVNHRVFSRMQLEERKPVHYPQTKPKVVEVNQVFNDPRTKPRDKQGRKSDNNWQTQRSAPAQNLAYALDTTNNPTNYEANVLSLLINLQHRDLTPEDYEILSMLDQSVAPKTVSQNIIDSFKAAEVGEAMVGSVCSICLEIYSMGQKVKYLPCGHEFHSNCIEMWLSNSSMNCPLDGLPVDS